MFRFVRYLQLLLLIVANLALGCSAPEPLRLSTLHLSTEAQATEAAPQSVNTETDDATHGEPSDAEGDSDRETDWLPHPLVDPALALAPDSSRFTMSHELPLYGRDTTRTLYRPPCS